MGQGCCMTYFNFIQISHWEHGLLHIHSVRATCLKMHQGSKLSLQKIWLNINLGGIFHLQYILFFFTHYMTFGNCVDFYPLLTSCYSLLSSKGLDIGIGRGCSSTIRCCNSSSSISIDGLFHFHFLNLFPPKSFNFSLNLLLFCFFSQPL